MSELKITDEFEGENVVITEDEIEAFCRVVGNEGEAYKKGFKGGMQVPMDFAIKLGWKVSHLLYRIYLLENPKLNFVLFCLLLFFSVLYSQL